MQESLDERLYQEELEDDDGAFVGSCNIVLDSLSLRLEQDNCFAGASFLLVFLRQAGGVM